MRALRTAALMVGLAAALILAYGLGLVYGGAPVPAGFDFPRHHLWGGGPGALHEGTLIEEDGCLITKAAERITIVWPARYALRTDGSRVEVDGDGRVVAAGEGVRLGGGHYDREQLEAAFPEAAGTTCPGPYFMTTGWAD